MMEIRNIRTGSCYDEDVIDLCHHISITCKQYDNDDGCEYVENIPITCRVCHITHDIHTLIN